MALVLDVLEPEALVEELTNGVPLVLELRQREHERRADARIAQVAAREARRLELRRGEAGELEDLDGEARRPQLGDAVPRLLEPLRGVPRLLTRGREH